MTARTTVLLLFLIAVVGGFLWWEQSTSPAGRGAGPSDATRPIFDLAPDDVVQIQLKRDGETREATRTPKGWPVPAIGDFLSALTSFGILVEISSAPEHAGEYGLRPPRAVATLYLSGGRSPLLLQIGDHNPPATGVYVRVGTEGQIGLAGALVDWEFEKAFRALGTSSAPASK